jgi:mycofactocin precursor
MENEVSDLDNLVGFDWDEGNNMNSKRKPIPQFSSEDEEWQFWATHDSSEYIDWSKAEKIPTFPRLKPPTGIVSAIENSTVEETADAMELDLELEEELIIEDFTIDGICGVY